MNNQRLVLPVKLLLSDISHRRTFKPINVSAERLKFHTAESICLNPRSVHDFVSVLADCMEICSNKSQNITNRPIQNQLLTNFFCAFIT